MKKIILIAILAFSMVAAGNAVSKGKELGIGIFGNFDVGTDDYQAFGGGVSLYAKDLSFGFSLRSGDGYFGFGVTGDYWFINNNLTSLGSFPLDWYIGLGFVGNVFIVDYLDDYLTAGARLPVGLQIWFIEPLEVFFELPLTLHVLQLGGSGDLINPNFSIDGRLGVRYYF